MLLAIFAALLWLTTYVPVLGLVTNFFLALPFMIFAYKNNVMNMVVFLIGSIILSFIFGTVFAIPLAITFGATGLVMGYFLQLKKSRGIVYFGGSIAFLLTVVVSYAISVLFFKVDIIDESIQLTKDSIESSTAILESLGQSPNEKQMEQLMQGMELATYLKPTLFVFAAFIGVFFIQLVSMPIARRLKINVPAWQPFRLLQLPKGILWIYLLALILSMVTNPEEGTFLFLALVNVAFLLQWLIVMQGLAFIHFICHEKKLPRGIAIVITVFVLLFSQLLYIVRILGIIDLGFDLRSRLKSQK